MNSHVLVIFGASGDLTKRKLVPALFSIFRQGFLPKNFAILGVSRTEMGDAEFRSVIKEAMARFVGEGSESDPKAGEFRSLLYYQAIDTVNAEDYAKVRDKISEVSKKHNIAGNCIFYLSTPPSLYGKIPKYLAGVGLNSEDDGWKRLIIEKPFGYDLESARALNQKMLSCFREHQVYRIDHFLGKETVQNILVFRFANEILDVLWNHRHIDHVEITSAEHIGVEGRGGYYDKSGVVRDMVQNHLLQALAMVAIEPPLSFDSESVRYETLKVFKSLRRQKSSEIPLHAVFGQYTGSTVKGKKVPPYREERGVSPDSRTDTFAAFKIYVDNSRWYDVPFYLRVGKRLPTRVTEVVLHFKKTPHPAFGIKTGMGAETNQLIIRVQPDEGILLKFGMKLPGAGFDVKTVNMDFHYKDLSDVRVPEPYERLLLDCIQGDATLYAHRDAVEECWKFVDPYIDYKENDASIFGYPAGTWGPKEAFSFIERDGRLWRYPCKNLANDGEYCEL
jgi:glucose-6-phosphate 1-dehydrogenase